MNSDLGDVFSVDQANIQTLQLRGIQTAFRFPMCQIRDDIELELGNNMDLN